MATANIPVAAGSLLAIPPVGEATLFIDTENNNILSLKLSDGSVRVYTADGAAQCCSCELAKKFTEDIGCALNSGMLPPDTYAALIQSGFSVTTTETDDGNGNKTCTVSLGAQILTPTGITIDDPGNISLGGGPVQLTKTVTPSGSNPGVVWVSLDPANGTIDAGTGIFTPLMSGVIATVEAYSVIDPLVKGSRTLTLIA